MQVRTTNYNCGKCGRPLLAEATYSTDDEYGDQVGISFECDYCQDYRVESLDEMDYGKKLTKLALLVGSKSL